MIVLLVALLASMPSHGGASVQDASPPASTTGRLLVRCFDQAQGSPVAGVRIVAFDASPRDSRSFKGSTKILGALDEVLSTNDQGQVCFVVPAGKELELANIDADPFLESTTRVPPLEPGELRRVDLTILRDDGYDMFLRVSHGGAPVPSAACVLFGKNDTIQSVGVEEAPGLYRVRVPGRKFHLLEIRTPGFGTAFINPRKGFDALDRAQDVELQREASLQIQIQGLRVPTYYTVRLSAGWEDLLPEALGWTGGLDPKKEWFFPVDGSGRGSIDGLPAGVPVLLEILSGSSLVHKERDLITLSPGANPLEMHLAKGHIEGVLLDPEGAPVRGVEIWLCIDTKKTTVEEQLYEQMTANAEGKFLFDEDEPRYAEARTNEEGRFIFERIPAGTWAIGPGHRGLSWNDKISSGDRVLPMAVKVETKRDDRTAVSLAAEFGTILQGKAVDSKGNGLEGLLITGEAFFGETQSGKGLLKSHTGPSGKRIVIMGDPISVGLFQTNTGPNGAFKLGPLPPNTVLTGFPRTLVGPSQQLSELDASKEVELVFE